MSEYLTREQQHFDLVAASVFRAVREHFSHLTIEEIINPPRCTADAYAALHMATAILCEDFDMSRRDAARIQMRSRGAILLSVHEIRRRRESLVYDRAYRRIALRAAKFLEDAERLAA